VRLIVNFAPGSSPDVVGRALVQPLQEALGQPVIVENRAGASGNVGAEAVVKSNADGHTLLVTAGSTISIGPLINAVPFDVNRDLTPVAAIARLSVFLVSRADLPPKTVKELVDYMKARPGKLSYGSSGSGSSLHIAGEMFKSQAGVFAVHVPYRGAAPSLQDLLAGHLDYAMDPGIAFPHVRSGRLRLLAVGTLQRASLFPDVPTLDEAGFKGFDAGTTHSVFAPAGTPADVIARLNREINQALSAPAVKASITNIGAEPSPMSPAQLNAIMQSDNRRYAAIIKERNIKPD
jgi:tripartite-type tricarboxylate transporter receptor subunit TctC